jgi:hypothetical protein
MKRFAKDYLPFYAACVLAFALAAVAPCALAYQGVSWRMQGEALSSEPAWPVTAQPLEITSTSDLDAGKTLYLWGLDQPRAVLDADVVCDGTTPVLTSVSFLRLNQARIWKDPTGDLFALGTITVKHGANTLATIPPGANRSNVAAFSVGPGLSNVVPASVTGNVTRIMHRRGQAPQSAAEVSIDGAAPGVGDFWIEGPPGEVSMDLEAR